MNAAHTTGGNADDRGTDLLAPVNGAPGRKDDSQATAATAPVGHDEREHWSILDLPRALAVAARLPALVTAAVIIFTTLIAMTMPRYASFTFGAYFDSRETGDRSIMALVIHYGFNGMAIIVGIIALCIAVGTLTRLHHTGLTGGKHMTIADTFAYLSRHAADFIAAPGYVFLAVVAVGALETLGFMACRFIPILYPIMFCPLLLGALLLLVVMVILYAAIMLAEPLVALEGLRGSAPGTAALQLTKKKPARVITHLAVNCLAALIAGIITSAVLAAAVYTMENLFVRVALPGMAAQYYQAAADFLRSTGSQSPVFGVILLLSAYLTAALFYAYTLSLFVALNTVSHLALKEPDAQV
ncbi:MAG: hypothetical protein ABIF71_11865 [Planctomycetota bacterium]